MNIIFILLLFGIIFIMIYIGQKQMTKCEPETKYIYKYIPRTFEEEQNEPILPSQIFNAIFTQPSPWVASLYDYNVRKSGEVNKYFVSQS